MSLAQTPTPAPIIVHHVMSRGLGFRAWVLGFGSWFWGFEVSAYPDRQVRSRRLHYSSGSEPSL
jgi:hypothetical protein